MSKQQLVRLSQVLERADREEGEAHAKLQELAERDVEEAWNRILALARFSFVPEIQLRASELLLAYAVGRPTTHARVENVPRRERPKFDLSSASDAELDAIRTLQEGMKRRSETDE